MNAAIAAYPTPMSPAQFLRDLYGDDPPGYLSVCTFTNQVPRVQWVKASDYDAAAALFKSLTREHDGYFGVCLHGEPKGNKRGTAAEAIAMAGFWLELDWQDAAHKKTTLPPTQADALSLIDDFPLPPTKVVFSGHGAHVWWLFRAPWIFETDSDNSTAAKMSRGFQQHFINKARRKGWEIDNTSDLARVLRPPGTWNRKREPAVPVEVIADGGPRYNPSDFEPFLELPFAPAPQPPQPAQDKPRHDVLRTMSVKLALMGLPPDTAFAALAQFRDKHLSQEGRAIPDSELWSLVNSADQKYEPPTHTLPEVVDLYSDAVQPVRPVFAVANLIPVKGIVLAWAVPNGLKTYTSAWLAHQLLDDDGADTLFSHPDLQINHRWGRVLWIGTEETAGELRERGDRIVAGMGCERPTGGRLSHLWASSPQGRVTLDHLPAILKRDGPLDAVVLDSLTGLRPPEVDGRRIAWDVDNDAANRVCIQLRGLAEEFGVVFIVLHHTGRDTAKGYRGPTDWWASADTMFGLVPREDRIEVRVEKNRHGRRIEPFLLQPTWTADAFTLAHVGAAPVVLKPSDAAVLSWMRSRHTASQQEITHGTELSIRTVKTAVQRLVQAQHIERTGEMDAGSPVYRLRTGVTP